MYNSFKNCEKLKLPCVIFCLVGISSLVYCVGVLFNDYDMVNTFLNENIKGKWVNWYLLLLIFIVLCGVYITALNGFVLWRIAQKKSFGCPIYRQLILFMIVVFCFIYWIAFLKLYGYNFVLALLNFRLIAPIFQIVFLLLHISLLYFITEIPDLDRQKALNVFCYSLWSVIYIIIFFLPYMYQNDCVSNDKLSCKPLLLAHRGRQNRAPENTYMAFKQVIEKCNGVFGFETDVRFSKDGVPFLMHDSDLKRTTNVAEIFPKRADEEATEFTWSELQQLNAGKWFLRDNPYMENHFLSAKEKEKASKQKILSFRGFIKLAKEGGKSVMFDMSPPPPGNKHEYDYKKVLVDTISDVGLDQSKVLWLDQTFKNPDLFKWFPNYTYVYHHLEPNAYPKPDALNQHYMEMLDTGNTIYKRMKIISYVVNTKWLYSMAWCRGSWAVTTSYPCELKTYNHPTLYLGKAAFYFVWTFINILFLAMVLVILYWKRDRIYLLELLFDNNQRTVISV